MKKSRLNDTAAGVEVRQIDNGYIACEYTSGPDGYKSSEKFSETKPTINNIKADEHVKPSSLKDAIDHCK